MTTKILSVMTAAFAFVAASRDVRGQETLIIERADADAPVIELGVAAGQPSGLSAKYWFGNYTAVQGGISWQAFGQDEGLTTHADLLLHSRPAIVGVGMFKMPLYVGVGGKAVAVDETATYGVRAPIGATLILDEAPLTFFGEVAPSLLFDDGGERLSADATIGARLYF